MFANSNLMIQISFSWKMSTSLVRPGWSDRMYRRPLQALINQSRCWGEARCELESEKGWEPPSQYLIPPALIRSLNAANPGLVDERWLSYLSIIWWGDEERISEKLIFQFLVSSASTGRPGLLRLQYCMMSGLAWWGWLEITSTLQSPVYYDH